MKKKMLSVAGLVLALVALMLLSLVPGLSVQAATTDTTGDIGFYVRAVLPENQMDKNLTYFDLRVAPGQTQQLEVEVVNETNEAIEVDVAAVSASTNRNGVIDYKTPDVRDESLKVPFSEIAALESDVLRVPAGGTATANVALSPPGDEYDGVVLGGLVFTRRPASQSGQTDGMTLQNVYSYVIGVKLSENDTQVLPDFELDSVQAEVVNYQASMVHSIRNRTAAIAKDIDLHVVVRGADGSEVANIERLGVDMAPNSVMPLAVTPVEGGSAGGAETGQTGTPAQLEPGDYTSEITLVQNGESWNFEQKFTVGSVEADNLNAESIGVPKAGVPFSTVLIILLAVAGVVILALFIILMRMLRRKEETKELNRLMRERQQRIKLQEKNRQEMF